MTSKLDWSSVGGSKSKSASGGSQSKLKNLEFIKFIEGTTLRIRPLGNPIVFLKAGLSSNGTYRSAIIEDPETPAVKKLSNATVSERYAVNVIDRADGQLKIMEGPISIFKEFKTYNDHTGKNPGAYEGADFNIKVTGQLKMRRYDTSFSKHTTLTEEEKGMIKSQGLYDLEKVFKVVPDDEIEERLVSGSKPSEKKNENKSNSDMDDLGLDSSGEVDSSTGDDLDLNF